MIFLKWILLLLLMNNVSAWSIHRSRIPLQGQSDSVNMDLQCVDLQPPSQVDRRSFISTSTIIATTASLFSFGIPADAASVVATTTAATITSSPVSSSQDVDANNQRQKRTEQRTKLRNQLLQMISSSSSEESQNQQQILDLIEQLVQYDPTNGRAATDQYKKDLDGEWKLLWSIKAEAFSPLLQLPRPFKPNSYQYLGSAASSEVGPDRVAQGLTDGALLQKTQLWLSSGVRNAVDANPQSGDTSTLEILPPFRFEVGGRYGSGQRKTTLVEAGSDADFRKLNARTAEAQAAPKNSYKQTYLELDGKGSLRISTITDGDPVIVGAVFVHQKL